MPSSRKHHIASVVRLLLAWILDDNQHVVFICTRIQASQPTITHNHQHKFFNLQMSVYSQQGLPKTGYI